MSLARLIKKAVDDGRPRLAWDEQLPDGTPAIDVGLPKGLKRIARVNPASLPAAPQFPPPDVSGIRPSLIARVDSGVSALPRQNDSTVVADTLPNLTGLVNRVNPADALFNDYRNQPLATDSNVPNTTLGLRRVESVDNRGVMPAPSTNVVPVGVQPVSGLPRAGSNEFAAPSVTQTSASPLVPSLSQFKPTPAQFNAPSVQSYGQSNTPEFNAPSVQAMVRPKADTQSDSTVPNIGVRPVNQASAPQDQQDNAPVNRPPDVSTIPASGREDALIAAINSPHPLTRNTGVTFKGAQAYGVDNQIPDSPAGVSPEQSQRVRVLDSPLGRLPGDLSGDALGNYIAGAMRPAAEQKLGSPVQATIINRSGLRKDSLPANVSERDIYETLPFDNKLVAVDVKGSDLSGFLGRNGNAMAVNGDVSNLDPNKTYTVAVPDYVVSRGGRRSLQGATNVRELGSLRDAVTDNIRGQSSQASSQSASSQQAPALPVASGTLPPASNSRQEAADRRRKLLEDEFEKLITLQNTKAVDHNGRWKSAFISAFRGFLQGVARTGSLGGGLGGAVSDGVYGAVHPAYDEELAQAAKVLKEKGKLNEALKIEEQLARIDALDTRTQANAQKNSPEAQAAKSRKELMDELSTRMRLAGGRVDPNDARAVELAQQLGIHGKQGGGFNAQRVRTLRGADGIDRVVYVDGPNDFHYLNGDGTPGESLSERDKKFLAIELEKENRQRALDGLGPLKWNDDEPTPAPASTPAPNSPAPSAPPTQQGVRPVLVPSGQKPEGVNPVFGRGHRGGRSYSRGSSGGRNERDQGFAESGAADARAKAAEARSRGDDEAAAAWEEKARVEDNRLRRAGGTPTAPQQSRSVFQSLPGTSAIKVMTGGRVSRAKFVERNPQYKGKSQREIDAVIRADGYEPY